MEFRMLDDLDQKIDEAFERAFASRDKNLRVREILNRPRKPWNFVPPSKASALIEEAEITDTFAAVGRLTRVPSGRMKEDTGRKKIPDAAPGHTMQLSMAMGQERGTSRVRCS